VLVNIGMWLKRFVIVVPTLALPLMSSDWGVYVPTWVEIMVTVAGFAGFALIFTLFAKLFPIISVWELQEGWEREHSGATVENVRGLEVSLQPGGGR
jgi:molybdopterin-containing oxidoreductase family membrane subunit